MESDVLKSVIAALPTSGGQALEAQIRAALFDRQMGGRVIVFRFPERIPTQQIERLGEGRLVLAVVKAQGQASRFTTTAKVLVSNGLIAELNFDLMPWSGSEGFNTECELIGLPKSPDPTDKPDGAFGAS